MTLRTESEVRGHEPVMRLPLLVALLVPACAPTPSVSAVPDDRGPVTITTWVDGEPAAGTGVYLHDADGEVRGRHLSGPGGELVVDVEPGWSATVVADVDGFRHADTALDLAPGDDVAIGQRRRVSGRAPVRIAAMDRDATVTVCGPTSTTTPAVAGGETVAGYDPRALDDEGGALIVAEAGELFALVDVADVPKLEGPITMPAWDRMSTTPIYVAADADAIAVEVRLRARHGCVVGAGAGPGPWVDVTHYRAPELEAAAAISWIERGARQTSWTSRRVAVQQDKPAPEALDADVPARVTGVAARDEGRRTVLGWQESGDPLAGDGVIVVAAPAYDAQWTLVMPRGRQSLVFPRLDELPDDPPQWANVSIVELDDVDGWAELSSRAGVPRWDEPGWTATGTVTNPVD